MNLSGNLIRNEGCKALAEALQSNTMLTSMLFSGNRYHEESVEALAKMLQSNTTLLKLEIDSPRETSSAQDYIRKRLEENTVLRRENISMLLAGRVHLAGAEVLEDMKAIVVGYL